MYRSFEVPRVGFSGILSRQRESDCEIAPRRGPANARSSVLAGSFLEHPELVRVLEQHVVPELLELELGGRALRGWVPACGAGERVYAFAMRLAQRAGPVSATLARRRWFGTALESGVLQRARLGAYPAHLVEAQAPLAWQRWFFLRVDDTCHVRGDLRGECVFGRHDLTVDAPLARLDLIRWQGPLLELGDALSERLCRAFRFALNAGGLLLLRPGNPVPALTGFDVVDAAGGLYRKAGATRGSGAWPFARAAPGAAQAVRREAARAPSARGGLL